MKDSLLIFSDDNVLPVCSAVIVCNYIWLGVPLQKILLIIEFPKKIILVIISKPCLADKLVQFLLLFFS